ncbi:transmembrane protein 144-like isoform X2 [Babylonia areolata]|uniref:transmembrane protein 144-like isoform X2 n=1 Tax=Babylonia areolata TaxID=304850 RepID=UPI003FD3CF82
MFTQHHKTPKPKRTPEIRDSSGSELLLPVDLHLISTMTSFWIICLCGIVFCSSTTEAAVVSANSTDGEIYYPLDTDAHSSVETTTASNTSADNGTDYPEYVGFITAGVAVIFYGSNFVPVKKYETGDGMFFQWMLCIGIFMTGLVVQIVRHSTFYPIVMLGGVIWATGNLCVVPIIKTIGMGLGLCTWAMFNLLGGWASGRFGWLGIDPEIPSNEVLNYVGVCLAVASSVIYAFVKNNISTPTVEMQVQVDSEEPLLGNNRRSSSINSNLTDQNSPDGPSFLDRRSPVNRRIIGIILSVFSGFLYGINFVPAIHVMNRVHGASQNSLDYVFAQYCGIFLASTFYFMVYVCLKRNKPQVYPQVILPALASGVMWAIATGCWFIANKALSEPVSFPIITTGPAALASLFWGVCIFKEITGRRNILILLVAVAVTVAGAILAGLSK